MNRPVFYKSFRSRKFHELEKSTALTLDVLSQEKNIIIDIGFGSGESTLALKKNFPECDIFGIEAYKPGVKKLLSENINVYNGDALEIIEKIHGSTISQIYMLFPDPWQKKKHRKRRLFNEYTFKIIRSIIKKNGIFHFATDNINYAFEARETINKVTSSNISFSKTRGSRPITKYEEKGVRKRNFVFDLIYIKR